MNRIIDFRVARAVAVLFTALILSPNLAAAQESMQEHFDVSPGGRLLVRAERGSIEVVSGESDEVRIEIIPGRGSVADFKDDHELDFHQVGNEVRITIEAHRRLRSWFSWNDRGFTLKAVVPRRFNADLTTSGGSIAVDDLIGDVRSKTSGGSLKFGRIEGPVWGRTSGGSIRLEQSVGDADVKTSGGSIDIGGVDGQVSAHTSGGSISIERARGRVEATTSGGSITARIASQPQGDCELSTSGGNVTIHLSRDLRFNLDARPSGGSVSTDVPVQARTVGKRELRGPINGGGPQLRLRTSGGRIRIKDLNR